MIRYVDICCGIGGFRVAIDLFQGMNKRFECVFSCDNKQDAVDTYNANFKENNKIVDLMEIQPDEVPEFDLLVAGFPCQPFSSAGHKKGFKDERGGIIFKILELCKHHSPSTVFLENVGNLLDLEDGRYMQTIQRLFSELGYKCVYKKLNMSDFGCAQSRERVYIVCKKEDSENRIHNPNFEDITKSRERERVVLKDVIDYDDQTSSSDINEDFGEKILKLHKASPIFGCKFGDKRGGKKNIHSWDLDFSGRLSESEKDLMQKIMLERRKKHWAQKKGIKWMDGMPLTVDDIQSFYEGDGQNLQSMLDNLESSKYLRREKCKDLLDGKRVFKEESEIGYNICKGKLSFPVSQVLDPMKVTPTLTATDAHKLCVIIGESCVRRLNQKELKRLSGFSDDFIVPSHVNAFDLFGNMASPKVVYEIIKIIYID